MSSLCIVLGIVSMMASSPPAGAQKSDPRISQATAEPVEYTPATSTGRDGWLLGIGVIGGVPMNPECSDCYTTGAFGMDMQIGRMLQPNLALMLDTHAVAVGQSEVETTSASSSVAVQGVAAIAVQWWPQKRWWLKGGIGRGEIQGAETTVGVFGSNAEVTDTISGFGFTTAAGYELYQGNVFALDLHARYASISADGSTYASLVFGLGMAWYL